MLDFLKPKLYFVLDYNLLKVRYPGTNREISMTTDVAIKNKVVVALGDDVQKLMNEPDISIKNGFTNPRIAIGDFDVAEQLIKYVIRKVIGIAAFRPIAIINYKRKLEGGLSQVELRSIIDCFESAGAVEILFYTGDELSDQEILNGDILNKLRRSNEKCNAQNVMQN